MGCEGMNEKGGEMTYELVNLAHANGVNYIDLYSSSPTLRTNLGKALKGRRGDFILQAHICTIWRNNQYMATRRLDEVKEGFSDFLERLHTDYIDVGMIRYVDSLAEWDKVVSNGILDYAVELKKHGKIKHIGISSHNPLAALKVVESGLIEVLMFSVNPLRPYAAG